MPEVRHVDARARAADLLVQHARTAPARAARGSATRWRSTPTSSCPTRRCRSARARWRRGPTRPREYYSQVTEGIAEKHGIDLDAPWSELAPEHQDLFLHGLDGDRVEVSYRNRYGRRRSYATRFEGIIPNLERRYRETDSDAVREKIEEYMSLVPCPACKGARLRPESRSVLVGGMAIHQFSALSVRRALEWLDEVQLTRPSATSRG